MARLAPKIDTIRALFAKSGNQCAFPGCTQPLINHKNQFIAQICHIEAAMVGGERYNSSSNDEYRRSYKNLLIFCYPHHVETNDVEEYTVERLKKIKNEHEQLSENRFFKIDESDLIKFSCEMEKYWDDIEILNKLKHKFLDSGLARKVNGKNKFIQVIKDIYEAVDGIEYLLQIFHDSDKNLPKDFAQLLEIKNINYQIFEDIPYYSNPFINRNWELHNIGIPNWIESLKISLVQIEVKYYEEYLKTHSNDRIAKKRFAEVKESLKHFAQNSIHID